MIDKIIRKITGVVRLFHLMRCVDGFRADLRATVSADSKVSAYSRIRNSLLMNSSVGKCTYIESNVSINNTDIGNYCSIAANVFIGVGKHPTHWLSTCPVFYSTRDQLGVTFADRNYFDERQRILIGNDVWIGVNAVVLDGITIGSGAIVAACAVVTKDVPPYAIVGGVPAKILRFRFDKEIIEALLELQWWNYSENSIRTVVNEFFRLDHLSIDDVCRLKVALSSN